MQKKIIALAVAGLSTAAIAQTNVTIYGVADVSAQGYNMSSGKAQSQSATQGASSGGSFNLTNNSSLLGFKGTEDLGNGLKGLFQVETNVNMTGGSSVAVQNGSTWGSMRDSYVGLNSKYGTVLGGYLSTPYRSALNSFDVMPGATGVGRIENLLGNVRLNNQNGGAGTANVSTVAGGGAQASASVRATALAYAMPTLYGFNGSIAYTGNGNSSNTTGHNQGSFTVNPNAVVTVAPQQALSLNLGWAGYGVDIKGAFQQAKVNYSNLNIQGYTSYLVGAAYTGIQNLKLSAVYGRNSLGVANGAAGGASKGSNNQFYLGASYRFGNNEPRISWATTSNTNGLNQNGVGQDGGRQLTANWGYYLSKRTQVYGLVSAINNNANGIWNMAGTGSAIAPTGGQNILTYGAGLRTNF